jgi:hypothetical protein
MATMGRYAARLYIRRHRAIERNVPFSLPGEAPGQGGSRAGQGPGQGAASANPLNVKAGQGGQGGQGTRNAIEENTYAHANLSPGRTYHGGGVPTRGLQFHPDHPDYADRASSGGASGRSGHPAITLTGLTAPPLSADDLARISAAGIDVADVLNGRRCRICLVVVSRPSHGAVEYGDGTIEHGWCYRQENIAASYREMYLARRATPSLRS